MEQPSTKLTYTIAGCSEHSGRYVAENILHDCPNDPFSRWTGTYPVPNVDQWILLKLTDVSVLTCDGLTDGEASISFGKYHKQHPCNMKEFKVFVGMSPNSLKSVLHFRLRDDAVPETFSLPYTNDAGVPFPVRFIKIVPLSAHGKSMHGRSFHISIWHIALAGVADPIYVESVRNNYDANLESLTLSYLLSHLRRCRLLTPYHEILGRTAHRLEHPLVSRLHTVLVLKGDFAQAVQTIQEMVDMGMFKEYLRGRNMRAEWKRLYPRPRTHSEYESHPSPGGGNAADEPSSPCARGGHAMCIDPSAGKIYLLGGYTGVHTLSDFWVYSISLNQWTLISEDTEKDTSGPGKRCCHKMVWDEKEGCIYLLGRLGEGVEVRGGADAATDSAVSRTSEETAISSTIGDPNGVPAHAVSYRSEFHRYHTRGPDAGKWERLSTDTASFGGPPLIFDHQMVMDSDSQMLYVFGGRIVDDDWDQVKYSGLYSYSVKTCTWKLLQPSESTASNVYIPPRSGHSMILDPPTSTLYIFAGQRDDKYLSDMYAYDLWNNVATQLYADFTASGGPDASFTQRAVGDVNEREVYVFCGLTRVQPQSSVTVLRSDTPNWVYRYDTRPGKWMRILPSEYVRDNPVPTEPQARYASQVVYDPGSKTVFMHGGNAGPVGLGSAGDESSEGVSTLDGDEARADKEKRLDDLWCMTLRRPAPEEVVRKATFRILRQQFAEMAFRGQHVQALTFLQNEVSSVVDHNDPEESAIFRGLLLYLLAPAPPVLAAGMGENGAGPSSGEKVALRGDMDSTGQVTVSSNLARSMCALEDPLEQELSSKSPPSSGEEYMQRMEVFEALLEFVGVADKQPRRDLAEVVECAQWRFSS